MQTRRTFIATSGVLGLAGCLGTNREASPTETATESPEPVLVEYVLRAGRVPAAFESTSLTLQAVFVDGTEDLGPCYPETIEGPYKPTATPVPTPAGRCHRSDPTEIDITAIDDEESLGPFTAPGTTSGHALIATRVVGRNEADEIINEIKGTGGARLIEEAAPPSGPYGVELGIEEAPDDRSYEYWFVFERFEPAGASD